LRIVRRVLPDDWDCGPDGAGEVEVGVAMLMP
jgi:hypothetical protein